MNKILLLLLLTINYVAFGQSDTLFIKDKITFKKTSEFYIQQKLIFPTEKFTAFGGTIPIFTNWLIGFPFARLEQSFYLYSQRKKNLSWYSRLTVPFVTYDVKKYSLPYNNGNAELFIMGTFFYKSSYLPEEPTRNIIIGRSNSIIYRTRQSIPKKMKRGINFGYFVSNQATIEDFSILHHGLILGFSQRKIVKIQSKLDPTFDNPNFYSIESISPTFKRIDKTFYTNLNISISSHFLMNQLMTVKYLNWKSIPLGAKVGWLFLNKHKMKKGFVAWNLELGIKGPIIYNVSSKYDKTYPWFYFTFRGFPGGMFHKKN